MHRWTHSTDGHTALHKELYKYLTHSPHLDLFFSLMPLALSNSSCFFFALLRYKKKACSSLVLTLQFDIAVWTFVLFVALHAAQTPSLQSWASPHRLLLDPHYSRMYFGSRRLHLWVSTTFSESILLFVSLITSAPLAHVQWGGEAGMWRQMLEEEQTFLSAKPQDCWRHCLTELLLTVGKEEPQRSFRLQSGEHCLFKESLPSVPLVYFCAVFISCHHKSTCSCTTNWPGELVWLKTHPAERKKKGKKNIFQPAQIFDFIYHTEALTVVPPRGR